MNPYQLELNRLIGGQIRHAGLSKEGYPYLIISNNQEQQIFYVFAQVDAEGNGAGFLHITAKDGRVV